MGFMNRKTVKCDVKRCEQKYSEVERLGWNRISSFLTLPDNWKKLSIDDVDYFICPKHLLKIKIDGELL